MSNSLSIGSSVDPLYGTKTKDGHQVISTKSLLNELSRLNCRFRQRGSHITFHHDDAGVRGTIVSGTRKLWSQKTVEEARLKIEQYKASLLYSFQEAAALQPIGKSFKAKTAESCGIFVADHVPDSIRVEASESNPGLLVLRLADHPQLGIEIKSYSHQSDLDWSLSILEQQKAEFTDTLELLEVIGDCIINKQDDDLLITHPILDINANLHSFDPEQITPAQDVLNYCADEVEYAEANTKLLTNFIRARHLTRNSRQEISPDLFLNTYSCQPFQGGFNRTVDIQISGKGFVTEGSLIKLMDATDKIFFEEIDSMIRKNYGFSLEKQGHNIIVKHDLLEGLTFSYPNFTKLPTLLSIYNRKDELEHEDYINLLNENLEKREAIIELVSYGLIFAAEQIQERSNLVCDCLEMMDNLSAVVKEQGIAAPDSERLKKKLFRAATPGDKFDTNAIRGEKPSSSIRNQSLPSSFPYGKIINMPVTLPDQSPASISLMIVKHEGQPLMLMSGNMFDQLKETLRKGCEDMGISSAAQAPNIDDFRKKYNNVFKVMTPSDPKKPGNLVEFKP